MLLRFLLSLTFLFLVSVSAVYGQESNTQPSADTEITQQRITTSPSTDVSPIDLTVSPISLNLNTNPATPTTSSIRIRNNSNSAEQLRLRLATFTANEAGDAPVIREFENSNTAKDWLTFSENQFTVGAGEWKTIQLTFSPPESAALGYYYAILVERQQEVTAQEGNSLVTGIPAILVLTEVNSPLAKRELQLVSFKATKKMFEYLPVEFEVVIRNTGNIQTLPVGDIFIDDQQNSDIGIVHVNPAKGVILPNSQRTYKVAWDDGFPRYVTEKDEMGNEKHKLEWDFSRANLFRFGKYTASLLFIYDDGQRDIPSEAMLTFWVVPWRLLLILLVLIILILAGIILPIMSFSRRIKKTGKKKTQRK